MQDSDHAVVGRLSELLADSYLLYLKTHNFQWNVTGPMFNTLHSLFEVQYQDLALAVDEVAERIRALGRPAPGSFAAFSRLAHIKEAPEQKLAAEEMLRESVADQKAVVETASRVLAAAQAGGDDVTADLAVRRMQVHQKNEWMLRTHLE